jgi:CubicO group peptidase (beta-lactamase class C family)
MIASVSKVFAGTAVLKLAAQGIIALDDDICDVMPVGYANTACRNPSWPDTKVTWRMLVTHRSSLMENIPDLNGTLVAYGPNGGYLNGTAGGNPACPLTDVTGFYRDIMIDKVTETTVGSDLSVDWFQLANETGGVWEEFEPGTESLYSNFAIGYIAALVEHATGTPFPQYCQNHIFGPLNMAHTAWFREDLPDGVLEAFPVEYLGNSSEFDLSDNTTLPPGPVYEDIDHYCFIDYASGSLRTTVKDMALFLESMLDYGNPSLWPRELGETAVQCAEPDSSFNQCEYGITWNLLKKLFSDDWLQEPATRFNWEDAAGHAGAEVGSQTQVILFPKSGIYAIVFTNTDGNDDEAAQEIMGELLYYAAELVNPSAEEDTSPAPERTSGTLSLLLLWLTTQIILAADGF